MLAGATWAHVAATAFTRSTNGWAHSAEADNHMSKSMPGMQYAHIYRGERSQLQGLPSEYCSKIEEDHPSLRVMSNRTRYPWHSSVRKLKDRAFLHGTGYAQDMIWKHQNPKDCSKVRFARIREIPNGIGGMLHLLGRALGLAFELGVILVLALGSGAENPWFDPEFCEHESWECWFLPLTDCRPHGHIETFTSFMLSRDDFIPEHTTIGGREGQAIAFSLHFVPSLFQHFLRRCTNVKHSMWYYWWLAQSVTYILRFNKGTRREIDVLRRKLLHVQRPGFWRPRRIASLPGGTVSMHVRHGDKSKEMKLVPFERYQQQARKLFSGNQGIRILQPQFADSNRTFVYDYNQFAGRTVFISTENPDVINSARLLTQKHQASSEPAWTLIMTLENRTNVDIYDMIRSKGTRQATLESFLNLELALEADAWVCTLFSNWCMLIDELRMTVAAKASAPYVNLIHDNYRRGDVCYRPLRPRCYTML